jgi:hypothetical protein
MTNHPPMFASQIADQGKWDEGFKAGIAEVLHELESAVESSADLEAPTKEWVADLATKLNRKYL